MEGYSCKVITYHSSLRWLHNLKNSTGRLARWSSSLLEYDFYIINRKGANHHVPDSLFRRFEDQNTESEPLERENLLFVNADNPSWYLKRFLAVPQFPHEFPNWKIVDDKLHRSHPDPIVSPFVPDLNNWKLVPTDSERGDILIEAHDNPQSGLLRTDKTYVKIAKDYYWSRYYKNVADYVKRCEICQHCKVKQVSPDHLGHRIIEETWTIVAADIMGPFPQSRSAFQYVLVFQDALTKYIEVVPLRSVNGKLVKKAFLASIIHRWGALQVLLTDNGTEFVKGTLKSLA